MNHLASSRFRQRITVNKSPAFTEAVLFITNLFAKLPTASLKLSEPVDPARSLVLPKGWQY